MRGSGFLIPFLLLLLSNTLPAATLETPKIDEVEWDESQEVSLTRIGKMALSVKDIEWKHARTEHFIYHYSKRWMLEAAATELETCLGLIKKDLKIEGERWEIPCQVFIFDSDAASKAFFNRAGVDPWVLAFYDNRNEIFLPPMPRGSPFAERTIPHELTHLVVDHFVRGKLPIWLNEGVAEQQGFKHFIACNKAKGINFTPPNSKVSPDDYIPLEELTVSNDYPADYNKAMSFYAEALRIVQVLQEDHLPENFLEFLQSMADGMQFEKALDRSYGTRFPSFDAFEEKLKDEVISKTKPFSWLLKNYNAWRHELL